ncbi:hypothetical protein [Mucilaginibacter lacusdianchii]|uniref:hypothetical protein n=1 Tax=Mucilaginibacter lacusdianchii TaxID=2684211 RepID=UPI00131DAE32|nr:hypothetical protein [Mucilaginibacter sp. JXJ CY 39]
MKDFDHLLSVWQAQPKPDKLEVDRVLKQVKKGTGDLSRKLMWNITGMLTTTGILLAIILFLPFEYWTTYAGGFTIILAVIICTCLMIRDYRILTKHDVTIAPGEYLQSLQEYQRGRARMYGWIYYIFTLMLSIGLSLYFFEVLSALSPKAKIIAYTGNIAWLLFITFYLKDRIFKREQEKLNLMIERLTRLQNQFE